jgi:hypothetical protein
MNSSDRKTSLRNATLTGAVFGATAFLGAGGNTAHAQATPTPFQMVSEMDFECRPATGPAPVQTLTVKQLNPVLQPKIPAQQATLGALEEICVPVSKNGHTPGPTVLPLQEWVDVACYPANAPPINVDVNLTHLNPQLAGLPDEKVTLTKLAQICVPVRKNNSPMPEPSKQFASFFDVGCYDLATPTPPANRSLVLSHLNPVIRAMGFEDRKVQMKEASRLCVPIAKNNQVPPAGVLSILRWADFLKYRVNVTSGIVPQFQLWLSHLNPLFAGSPPFPTVVGSSPIHLLVPVAKDGQLPPGGPGGL